MAERFEALSDKHIEFIEQQHLFFVGTAAAEGTVNVSPKGMDSLRVLSPSKVLWLNLTGSGNETAAQLRQSNRMTIMFCSLEKTPLILRLYGQATMSHPWDAGWADYEGLFPSYSGARQIFAMEIQLVQTSCGYAVPRYDYAGERPTLRKWAENKGAEGIRSYWLEKNTTSLDGLETGMVPPDAAE